MTDVEVQVWWSRPSVGGHEGLDLLDEHERERAQRLREPKSRAAYVAAHALVRTALAQELGIRPREVVVVHDALGAPRLGGGSEGSPLRFSLTHTDALVACALARSRHVGIDAELRSRGALVDELAETTLTEGEREALEGGDEATRAARFLELFTRKEAYLKARGVGLAVEMSSFDLAELDPRWHFASLPLSSEHQVSLAALLEGGEVLRVAARRA